jgi:hypothetical protein
MLSGSHCPESNPDKQDQEASAPVFDRSEGIGTPIDGKGDCKGENGMRYFDQSGNLVKKAEYDKAISNIKPSGLVYLNFDEHRKSSQSDCGLNNCPIH